MLMLFSAVLLNFILGTIIYIIWKLLGRLAESKGYVEINYWKCDKGFHIYEKDASDA